MRILIVDDNEQLAETTAELLLWIDRRARYIETITLASDLATAIRLVAKHDAVLCDGQFLSSDDSLFTVEEWDAVCREALRCGTHFVLYSACARALDEARVSDIPAIAKPAPIEEIYTALTEL
jgi:CheY-like chemotaxis protein